MSLTGIHEEEVSYDINEEGVLRIYVNGCIVASVSDCFGDKEYVEDMVDGVLNDLGYYYVR